MKTFALIVMLVIAVAVVIWFLKQRNTGQQPSTDTEDNNDDSTIGMTFFKKPPLTDVEQTFYFRLVEALPDYIVLTQVQVSQIVGIKKGPKWQTWFNKISRKSVDFLIVNKGFTITAAIELDDSTHLRDDRIKSDKDKTLVFEKAGIPLLRCEPARLPSTDEIRRMIQNVPR